jgi:hypothetical protein
MPTNHLLRHRHPPSLIKKKCFKFAKKYWKKYFSAKKQWPSAFVERKGPRVVFDDKGESFKAYEYFFKGKFYSAAFDDKGESFKAYEYFFKGKFYSAADKAVVKGKFSILIEVLPNAAEIMKAEKARHPHPDWYDWKMTYKNKGKMVRIQPKGQMTIYQIRKPIIDASGKHLKADISNSKYWGKST